MEGSLRTALYARYYGRHRHRHRHHLSLWHKSQSSGEEGEEERGATAVRTTCSVSRTCVVFPEEASNIHRFSKGSSHITVHFGFEIKDKLPANNFFTTNWRNPLRAALLCTWYAGHPFCIHFTRHSLGRRERKWLTEHKRRGGGRRGKSVTIRISVYICISGMGGSNSGMRKKQVFVVPRLFLRRRRGGTPKGRRRKQGLLECSYNSTREGRGERA